MTALLYIGIGVAALVLSAVIYLLLNALWPGFDVPARPLPANETEDGDPVGFEAVGFDVGGVRVNGRLYLPPAGPARSPCIVMAHGLGGTVALGLDGYARAFRDAGFAVLAFDYRFVGASEGEPRQLVWIPRQLEDHAAALALVRGRPEIDPDRVGLWGSSLSGGHALVTAAQDPGVACVAAQCPLLDGDAGGMELLRELGFGYALGMLRHAQRDLVRSLLGLTPHRIPLVGPAGAVAAMGDDEAWEFFQAVAPPGFVNEVCARILIRMDKYHPIRRLGSINVPVLLQTCDGDPSCPAKTVDDAAARLGERGRVIRHPIGHFDIYRGEHRERALREQIEFFEQHLLPAAS
jgi:uncharacterized protein